MTTTRKRGPRRPPRAPHRVTPHEPLIPFDRRTLYITGATNDLVRFHAFDYRIGLLHTPDTAALRRDGTAGGYRLWAHAHPVNAADNGAYGFGHKHAKGKRDKTFDPAADWAPWAKAWWAGIVEDGLADTVAFMVIPDKLNFVPRLKKDGTRAMDRDGTPAWAPIGDALTTVLWAYEWIPWAKENLPGAPLAFVGQDGMEDFIDEIPWDDFEFVFLGGSTEWKIGEGARRFVEAAKARGKRVHMGRVNSAKRMAIASSWNVDTADGTFVANGSDIRLPELLGWVPPPDVDVPLPLPTRTPTPDRVLVAVG